MGLAGEDTGGRRVAVAFEMKNQRLTLPGIRQELERAVENRDAVVAVAVFASSDQAPSTLSVSTHGDKAVCVYDPDDGDERSLALAFMWARMTARRTIEAASG